MEKIFFEKTVDELRQESNGIGMTFSVDKNAKSGKPKLTQIQMRNEFLGNITSAKLNTGETILFSGKSNELPLLGKGIYNESKQPLPDGNYSLIVPDESGKSKEHNFSVFSGLVSNPIPQKEDIVKLSIKEELALEKFNKANGTKIAPKVWITLSQLERNAYALEALGKRIAAKQQKKKPEQQPTENLLAQIMRERGW